MTADDLPPPSAAGELVTTANPVDAELARAVGAVGGDTPSREQLGKVLTLSARSARSAGLGAVTSGRWLTEVTLDAASHLPVRDLATLRDHFDGLDGPLLAGALIRNASLTTGAVGGITGAIAAASELTPATWTALPFELLGETLVVVAIEMKLVAELHEAAHRPLEGSLAERGSAIAQAWSESRGIRPSDLVHRPLRSTASDLVGRQARGHLTTQLRRRLLLRAGRNITSLAPFMAGALAGAGLNRRATRKLGSEVASSLGIAPPR